MPDVTDRPILLKNSVRGLRRTRHGVRDASEVALDQGSFEGGGRPLLHQAGINLDPSFLVAKLLAIFRRFCAVAASKNSSRAPLKP